MAAKRSHLEMSTSKISEQFDESDDDSCETDSIETPERLIFDGSDESIDENRSESDENENVRDNDGNNDEDSEQNDVAGKFFAFTFLFTKQFFHKTLVISNILKIQIHFYFFPFFAGFLLILDLLMPFHLN